MFVAIIMYCTWYKYICTISVSVNSLCCIIVFIFSLFCSVSVLNTLTKYFFLQIFNLTSYSLWFSIFHQPSPPRLCKFYLSTFFTPIYFVSRKIIFPYFASYLFPRILRDLTNTSTEFSFHHVRVFYKIIENLKLKFGCTVHFSLI